jgi:hypothetical protein
MPWHYRFISVWTALLFLLLASGRGLAAEPSAPIPVAEIGARAEAQQPTPAPVIDGGRATLSAPLQALRGQIGPEGLTVESTSASEGGGDFRLVPQRLSKGAAPLPLPSGTVNARGSAVVLDRGPVREVFTASADGLRQDFVVATAPPGEGPLSLTLALTGASAQADGERIVLTLPGGRRLVYGGLHITDATGQVLTGTLASPDAQTLTITVTDAGVRYPLTLDPTISDADWQVLNPGLPGANDTVNALAFSADGTRLYVGGRFTAIGNVLANHIAQWNGSSWSALGTGITGMGGQLGYVNALAVAGDGTLYAGGLFATAGGIDANFVAQWNGSTWSALGSGSALEGGNCGNSSCGVYSLAVAGGTLYAGGLFTVAGAPDAKNIAQWNGSGWSALGTGMDSWVTALAVSGDTLYAGGGFHTAGGIAANLIAQWDGHAWSALGAGMQGSGMNDSVDALAVSGNTLYAGGHFLTAGGTSANSIAQWDDNAWSPLGTGIGGSVYALAMSGGTLYAGGNFWAAGETRTNSIARWDGHAWSPLGTGIVGAVHALTVSGSTLYAGGESDDWIAQWNGSTWSSLETGKTGVNHQVSSLAVRGGTLYLGGFFTTAGGVAANHIVQWDGSAWLALGTGMSGDNPRVNALAVAGDGTLYAGGYFATAGGTAANGIAHWNGHAWSALGTGMNGEVYALAVAGDGTLYAGGDFNTVNEVYAPYIAQWNGHAWSALGTGMNYVVYALTIGGDGTLYASGPFTAAGGTDANHVARWNGRTWSALGTGTNDYVSALAVSGGTLYAGGGFTTAGGIGANGIAQWDGHAWSPLGTGLLTRTGGSDYPGVATALAVAGGMLYAGGYFNTAGGFPANCIAQWDGRIWSALGSGLSNTGYQVHVRAFASSDTALYVGGLFMTAGDKFSPYAAYVRLFCQECLPNRGAWRAVLMK